MEFLLLVREFFLGLTGFDLATVDWVDWIITYMVWTMFGFYLIFVLRIGGFYQRLVMYEHIDRRVGFIATGLVVLMWAFAPIIVEAAERLIMKRHGAIRS